MIETAYHTLFCIYERTLKTPINNAAAAPHVPVAILKSNLSSGNGNAEYILIYQILFNPQLY